MRGINSVRCTPGSLDRIPENSPATPQALPAWIDHIHLRRAAIKMDINHRLGRAALVAFRAKQIRQREAAYAQRARAQKTAAR